MTTPAQTNRLAELDHAHVWHPFTPMRQWRESSPIVIERGEGPYLFDTEGRRYVDGVSSLWCNIHGHQVEAIDEAIRDQLGKVAHTTMLGLSSPPAIAFAARLVDRVNRNIPQAAEDESPRLNKVFFSDAGATAVEAAFKMAVGYWYHNGRPEKRRFIGLQGAYHGDTVGSMSVGYSPLFHKAFVSMVFDVTAFPSPDALRFENSADTSDAASSPCSPSMGVWPSEDEAMQNAMTKFSLDALAKMLEAQAHETAAIVIEPIMQGAAGMVCQPPGFLKAVGRLARKHDVLLICDEVAVGFGRTGTMFAFEHELDTPETSATDGDDEHHFRGPDILCLAKGISAGYLPLAATLTTDAIEDAFTGELDEKKTLYHGHTYTGNPLACAAALASLDLFDQPTHGSPDLLSHIEKSAALITEKLDALRGHPHILDIRQRGLMVGIELGQRDADGKAAPFDFSKRTGYAICDAVRERGIIIRPLGDILVLMPIPGMSHDVLGHMLDEIVEVIMGWEF